MITKQFSSKLKEEYAQLVKEGLKELPYKPEIIATSNNNEVIISELITHYEVTKILLALKETEKEKLLLDYDNHFLVLKKGYIEDGCKPTEAKELANNDLQNTQMELIFIDEDIALLKANIHTIEYELRLKFIQAKKEFNKNLALFDTFPFISE